MASTDGTDSTDAPTTNPAADNEALPDRVPDPATDDLEAGEEATDATAEDALRAADAIGRDQHGDPDQVT